MPTEQAAFEAIRIGLHKRSELVGNGRLKGMLLAIVRQQRKQRLSMHLKISCQSRTEGILTERSNAHLQGKATQPAMGLIPWGNWWLDYRYTSYRQQSRNRRRRLADTVSCRRLSYHLTNKPWLLAQNGIHPPKKKTRQWSRYTPLALPPVPHPSNLKKFSTHYSPVFMRRPCASIDQSPEHSWSGRQ